MSAYFFATIVCALILSANAGVDYQSLISRIRDKIADDHRSQPDAFSESDIARLNSSDFFVMRYLIRNSDNEDEAIEDIGKTLRYRRSIGINDHNDTHFPAEFYALKQFTLNGEWADGTPTMIYSMANYFPTAPAIDELYIKFLLHEFNKVELIALFVDLSKADKCYGGRNRKSQFIPDGVKGGKCLKHLNDIESTAWEQFYEKNADRLQEAVKEANANSLADLFKC